MGRLRSGASFPGFSSPGGSTLKALAQARKSNKNKKSGQTLDRHVGCFPLFPDTCHPSPLQGSGDAVWKNEHLQVVIGRVYHLLTKEAAYGPNLHHMDDFRAAQKLEKSLDSESVPSKALRPPAVRSG
jgi:hypothetical protein